MIEWVDEDHIKGEMSDAEFLRAVERERKERIKNNESGRDGHMTVYEELFVYQGIPYRIGVCRYYQIGVPLDKVYHLNRIGKHVVLEYPECVRPLVEYTEKKHNADETLDFLHIYDFLYRDTLHAGQHDWTLEQMVRCMHHEAKACIDALHVLPIMVDPEFLKLMKALEPEVEKIRRKQDGKNGH